MASHTTARLRAATSSISHGLRDLPGPLQAVWTQDSGTLEHGRERTLRSIAATTLSMYVKVKADAPSIVSDRGQVGPRA
jgi:hypothetical protein